MHIQTDIESGMVSTSFGAAPIGLFKDVVYVNADDVEGLLNISGGKFSANSMVYKSNSVNQPEPVKQTEAVIRSTVNPGLSNCCACMISTLFFIKETFFVCRENEALFNEVALAGTNAVFLL